VKLIYFLGRSQDFFMRMPIVSVDEMTRFSSNSLLEKAVYHPSQKAGGH
jgi:hypothetical protein